MVPLAEVLDAEGVDGGAGSMRSRTTMALSSGSGDAASALMPQPTA